MHNVNGYHYTVASSARTQSWNQYGNWAYGTQHACHSYSGANLLYGWAWNPSSYGQYMTGNEFWGSESPC